MLTYWETLIATQSNIAVSDSYAALWGKKAQNNYTVETYTGALPVTFEDTVAGNLVSYKIWGNTGGVGVKKANLAEGEQLLRNASMSSTGEIVSTSSNYALRMIPVVEGKEYSIVNIYGAETSISSNFYAFFDELPQIGSVSYDGRRYSFKTPSRTFIAPITGYLATSDYYSMYDEQHSNLIPLEVYEGNASPYYIPIVSVSETTNIYIGRDALEEGEYADSGEQKIYRWAAITGLSEPLYAIGNYADSLDLSTGVLTRRIKKLVLTGEENFTMPGVSYRVPLGFTLNKIGIASYVIGEKNSHFIVNDSSENTLPYASMYTARLAGSGLVAWFFLPRSFFSGELTADNCKSEFKYYLAQQYAAGTPVTLWYVLAEPETSTIPVPSGLTGTIEGYLMQDGTPTPENPIYPTANGVEQTDGTYTIENAYLAPTEPPVSLSQIPTFAPTTTISYGGTGAQPEKVEFKYKVKR